MKTRKTIYRSISHQSGINRAGEHPTGYRPGATRCDAAMEEAIWKGILNDHSLGSRYQENIAVDVEDGRVWLRGHVLKQWHSQLIFDMVERIAGFVWVKNELIADEILQDQVIRALLQDETTSPYIFTVRSNFGWINLAGLVPGCEIARAAEAAAGFVPGVRGILSLPSVFGANWLAVEEPEPVRRALQPRLTADILQDCEGSKPMEAGWVSQVIIDPCSRLVSAIGVRENVKGAGDPETAERLVPMTAVEATNEKHVWLKEGEMVAAYPAFERSKYPLPPPNWQPPFPYTPGTVRWDL